MLRQEINFYRPETKTSTTALLFTWKRLWISNAIATMIFSLIYLLSLLNTHYLINKKNTLQKQLPKLQLQFAKIKNLYPELFFSQEISKTLDTLQYELENQEKILQSLENPVHFSKSLLAIADSTSPNVWLTGVTISKNGNVILLKGHSLNMDNLHYYIAKLSRQPLFKPYVLTVNNIEKTTKNPNENGNLDFEIVIART